MHRFLVPAPGFTTPYLTGVVVGLVTTAVFVAVGGRHPGLAMVVLPMILVALYYTLDAVQEATCADEVVVTPHEITQHHRSWLADYVEAVPTAELEELEVQAVRPHGGADWELADAIAAANGEFEILARTDRLHLHLARSLPTSELEWIRQTIEHVVCS